MADIHGSPGDAPQMPSAPNAGPAPVPYGGGDQSPEPPGYSVGAADFAAPGIEVMSGVTGANHVQESGYAHDINAGLVTPYYAGAPSAIYAGGSADAGGRDDVAGTVAGAVGNAEARYMEHLSDVTNAGAGHIGDNMDMPTVPEDANAPSSDFLFAEGDQPGKGT